MSARKSPVRTVALVRRHQTSWTSLTAPVARGTPGTPVRWSSMSASRHPAGTQACASTWSTDTCVIVRTEQTVQLNMFVIFYLNVKISSNVFSRFVI